MGYGSVVVVLDCTHHWSSIGGSGSQSFKWEKINFQVTIFLATIFAVKDFIFVVLNRFFYITVNLLN
jgi:hypothetical protein